MNIFFIFGVLNLDIFPSKMLKWCLINATCKSNSFHSLYSNFAYLDLRKAFDSISHRRLLQKLEAYGIEVQVLEWNRGLF